MKELIYQDEINLTPLEHYMQECFELAKLGLGRTSPNPVVGAIVLDKNGTPVGKGYHKKAGEEHAEVIAINEAKEQAKGGTIIVNLEPCCHIGKTPACTDLIINSQIKKVIFSTYDPNPMVNKKSEEYLLKNNIKVVLGILESEGIELNKFFFKWIKTNLPWVTLKQAQTLDGKVGLVDKDNVRISNKYSTVEVHNLRNIYDAILVGANTVEIDNPELTVRDSTSLGRNPARIILDPNLKTNPNSNVYKNDAQVYLVTREGHLKEKLNSYLRNNAQGKNYLNIIELSSLKNGKLDLQKLFYELGKKNILSVLVEAGPKLAGELIFNKLIDEYVLFISPIVFGIKGVPSVALDSVINNENITFELFNYKSIGNDFMLSLRYKGKS